MNLTEGAKPPVDSARCHGTMRTNVENKGLSFTELKMSQVLQEQYKLSYEERMELSQTQRNRLKQYAKARKDERDEIMKQFHLVPKAASLTIPSDVGIDNHTPRDPPSDKFEEGMQMVYMILKEYRQSQFLGHQLKEPAPEDPQEINPPPNDATNSSAVKKYRRPRAITLTKQDIETIGRGNYANDTVLTAILYHITRKNKAVVALNTFVFFNICKGRSTTSLTKGIDIFGDNITEVFIPCHLGSHWVLAIFRPKSCTIEMVDSLKYVATCGNVGRRIAAWIQQEAILQEHPLGTIEVSVRGDGPLQTDSYSCGLFMVHYADCIANKREPVVNNINNQRIYWMKKMRRYLKKEEPEDVKGKEEEPIIID